MSPQAGPATRRGARALGAVAAAATLVAAVVGLHLLGRGGLSAPPVGSWTEARDWAEARTPVAIALSLFRLVALGLAYHLAATTALATVGRVLHRPRLSRLAEAVTLPPFRGVVRRGAGLALSATAVLSGPLAPAAGAPRSPVVATATLRELPPVPGHAVLQRLDPAAAGGAGRATLRLVADASVPVGPSSGRATLRSVEPAAPPAVATHRVVPGDHLWSIAEQVLGLHLGRPPTDAEVDPYWRAVVAANPQLADPDLLHPGELITVPALLGSASRATLRAEPGA